MSKNIHIKEEINNEEDLATMARNSTCGDLTNSMWAGRSKTCRQTTTPETEEGKEASQFPLTVKDVTDNEITLEEAPKAIVSMIPSNTEILYALGLEEEIVGVSDFDNYPEEAASKEKIGGMEFNVEKIIA